MRQQRTIGSVLAVPLGDGEYCFALILPEADFAFFDIKTNSDRPPDDLLDTSVLFRVSVHKSAWSKGRWRKVGKVSVPAHLLQPQPKFIQDEHAPKRLEIYIAGLIRPASREECIGLERAAVWDPNHVEDRLRDHFDGVPNKWFESLRLV